MIGSPGSSFYPYKSGGTDYLALGGANRHHEQNGEVRPPLPLLSLEVAPATPFCPFKPIGMESRWILGTLKVCRFSSFRFAGEFLVAGAFGLPGRGATVPTFFLI